VIVATHDLGAVPRGVSMVDGGFDPLHAGHVAYFRAARALGRPLLCNLSGDHYVRTKHEPLLPEEQRAAVLDALRDIDYVHISNGTTVSVLDALRPAAYVKGADWRGRLPAPELALCSRLGIEIVYVDTVVDSSSRLLREYLRANAGAPA
jgi:cytidyltransferase-like protein